MRSLHLNFCLVANELQCFEKFSIQTFCLVKETLTEFRAFSQETFKQRTLLTQHKKYNLDVEMRKTALAVTVVLVFLAASCLVVFLKLSVQTADDWSMFHHDLTHTGYSTSAGPVTNQILWSHATYVKGTGNTWVESSPTIADGVLYVSTTERSEWGNVFALNAQTGAYIWSFSTSSKSSPAIANNVVYVGSGDNVYALGSKTGELIWSYTTGGRVIRLLL